MEMETNSRNIFWGLVVKPGKRYEAQGPFRITRACLEMSTAGESNSSLIACDNNEEFIIANLSSSVSNWTLDLSFNEGQKICFKVDGPGTVYLTGVGGAAKNFTEEPSQGSPRVEEAEEEEADLEGAAKNFTQEQVEAVKRVRRCKNYYEILGLSKDSSDADLKKAYRKLALAFHPDKNKTPGASEAFKAIGNAYAVLSDEGKRRRYDLYGSDEEQQTARSSSSSFVESSDDSD